MATRTLDPDLKTKALALIEFLVEDEEGLDKEQAHGIFMIAHAALQHCAHSDHADMIRQIEEQYDKIFRAGGFDPPAGDRHSYTN